MICPHCEGTGWAGHEHRPINELKGKHLSPREGEIVSILKAANGQYLTIVKLLNRMSGDSTEDSIYVLVSRIKKKFPGLIKTQPWHGYALNMEALEDA